MHAASFARNTWHVVAVLAILAGILVAPTPAVHARTDPSLDLAALILHSDDFDWLLEEIGLLEGGYPYGQEYSTSHTSPEEAVAHEAYALGRGGFSLDLLGKRDAIAMLDDAGWIRAQSAWLSLPSPGMEGYWSLAVSVTIEEFATADGAEEALTWFDDASLFEKLTLSSSVDPIALAPGIDRANIRAWEFVTSRFDDATQAVTLWAQVDTMIVSISLMHSSAYMPPDPYLLAPLVKLQLKRLELAEYLYQPGLSACAPEFRASEAFDTRAEYLTLNGTAFALSDETFDDLEAAQSEVDDLGIIDSYMTNQSIDDTAIGAYDGTMWFRGQVRTFTDDDAAEEFLSETGETLEAVPEYSNVEQLDDHPVLGDGTALFNYDASDDFAATVIYVQVENQVFSIRLGSMTDYQPDAVIELAEAQLERMDGDCDTPLELPDAMLDATALFRHDA